jgi:hypothetical protein
MRAGKAHDALGGGRSPSHVARAEEALDQRWGIIGRLRGWSGIAVVGVQGRIQGGGLGRQFYGASSLVTMARAAAAG